MRLRHLDVDYYDRAARQSSARYRDTILHVCELDLAGLEDGAAARSSITTECISVELGAREKAIDSSGLSKPSIREARERFLRCVFPLKVDISTRIDAFDENVDDCGIEDNEKVFELETTELELDEEVFLGWFSSEKEVPLEATTVAGSVMEDLFPMKQEVETWNYPYLEASSEQRQVKRGTFTLDDEKELETWHDQGSTEQRQAKISIFTFDVLEPLEFDFMDDKAFFLLEEFPEEVPLEVLSEGTAVEKLLAKLLLFREETPALHYSGCEPSDELTFLLEPAMVSDEDQSLCGSFDPNVLSAALGTEVFELEVFGKLSAEDIYQRLIVMPELSQSSQLLKLLPLPTFLDEEQDLLQESLFVKIAFTSTYPQGSATDFLYFDWHLSQGSNCNNQQCFLRFRKLECAPEKLPTVDLYPVVHQVATTLIQTPRETKLQAHLDFPSSEAISRSHNRKRPVQSAVTIEMGATPPPASEGESATFERPVKDAAPFRPPTEFRAAEVYAGRAEAATFRRQVQNALPSRTEVLARPALEVYIGEREAEAVAIKRPAQGAVTTRPGREVLESYAGERRSAEKRTLPDAQPKVTGRTQHEMQGGCNLVIVVNIISLHERQGITSRRRTYQAVLNTEKAGGQVVEREMKLAVDLILTASRCLVLYSTDKLSLNVSGADVAACIEGIIDNDMKAMSFCFRHCTMVFEGDGRFICSVLENMDDFYAAAVGLNIQVQCFVSSSIDDTEVIILNCIKESQQLMSGTALTRMTESETIAEAFLTRFPAINPLTAHAILSSGMSLSSFITLTHSEQVLATKAFDVPVHSLALFKAQCEYGHRHEEQFQTGAEWPFGGINAGSSYSDDRRHPCVTNPEDPPISAEEEAEPVPYFPSVTELNEEWGSSANDRFQRPEPLAASYFAPSLLEDKAGTRSLCSSWDLIEPGDMSHSSINNNDYRQMACNRSNDFGYSTNRRSSSSVENALKSWLETRQQQQKSKVSSNMSCSAPSVANKKRRSSIGSTTKGNNQVQDAGSAKFLDAEDYNRQGRPANIKARRENLLSLWENFRYRSSSSTEHSPARSSKGGLKRAPPPPALQSSKSKRVTI